jgi:hypothetical protein
MGCHVKTYDTMVLHNPICHIACARRPAGMLWYSLSASPSPHQSSDEVLMAHRQLCRPIHQGNCESHDRQSRMRDDPHMCQIAEPGASCSAVAFQLPECIPSRAHSLSGSCYLLNYLKYGGIKWISRRGFDICIFMIFSRQRSGTSGWHQLTSSTARAG